MTNQLWRNAILALAAQQKGLKAPVVPDEVGADRFDEVHVIVASERADRTATNAAIKVQEARAAADGFVRHITFNQIIERAIQLPDSSNGRLGSTDGTLI